MNNSDPVVWETIKDEFNALVLLDEDEQKTRIASLRKKSNMLADRVQILLTAHRDSESFLDDEHRDKIIRGALIGLETIPDLVGPYEVIRELGRGGMGVVCLARDTRLGRNVALKFLSPQLSFSGKAKARFLREARSTSAIDHPNVATIYDVGETLDGLLYITMQYYEGETLEHRLDEGALPFAEASSIASQIARALHAGHEHGIIHRDVKPGNIIVTTAGEAILVDFGIATLMDHDATNGDSKLGTVAYMSPEQTRTSDVDARTDIWALGIVFYQMLSGAHPFDSSNQQSTIFSIRNDSPNKPSSVNSAVPDQADSVVLTSLDKNSDNRYQSAEEFGNAIDALVTDRLPLEQSNLRRLTMVGTAAVVLLGIVLIYMSNGQKTSIATVNSAADSKTRVAVLPTINLSGSEHDYLSDGVFDEIVRSLSSIDEIHVIGTGSASAASRESTMPSDIAAILDVPFVVTGTIRTTGSRSSIQMNLIDVSRNDTLTTIDQTGEVVNVGVMTRNIVDRIGRTLGVATVIPSIDDDANYTDAYLEYLKGRYYWHKRDTESVQTAIAHFSNALDIDPTFARGWVGMADSYVVLGSSFALKTSESYPRAREAAERALFLDSNLAEAHTSLASTLSDYYWEWTSAEDHFLRAIEIDPNYSTARQWYAEFLAMHGRYAEALQQAYIAEDADPLSVPIQQAIAHIIYLTGDLNGALDYYDQIVESNPEFQSTLIHRGLTYQALGEYQLAIDDWATLDSLWHGPPNILGLLGHAYALSGKTRDAEKILRRLYQMPASRQTAFHKAVIHLALQQFGISLQLFREAFEERDWLMTVLYTDPTFDPLRELPEFNKLLDDLGFGNSPVSAPNPFLTNQGD